MLGSEKEKGNVEGINIQQSERARAHTTQFLFSSQPTKRIF